MRKDPEIKLIDITQAAAMLGRTPDTLRQWDRKGILPAIRLATRGKRMYKREDVEKFIQKQK